MLNTVEQFPICMTQNIGNAYKMAEVEDKALTAKQ